MVSGDVAVTFDIEWNKKVSRAGFQEPVKFTEKAAEAVSFLLTPHLTGYTIIKEARIGTGVDYWLGYDKQHELYDPENFLKGQIILNETAGNTVEKRVAEKSSGS